MTSAPTPTTSHPHHTAYKACVYVIRAIEGQRASMPLTVAKRGGYAAPSHATSQRAGTRSKFFQFNRFVGASGLNTPGRIAESTATAHLETASNLYPVVAFSPIL